MKMFSNYKVSMAILWAAAILASALLGGSEFLTVLILPLLGYMAISNYDNKTVCRSNGVCNLKDSK